MPKIVTIGGGTGAPIIINALLQAGFSHLSCICASMDSGGKTGIIRSDERDQVIAISDLLRNLIALISTENHQKNIAAFTDLVSYIDGRQRNIGYLIYYALLEKYQNDFLKVQEHLEDLLGIKFAGTAIPVTTDPTNINFKTMSGSVFKGEHELDKQTMSKDMIIDFWLDPLAKASSQAVKAIIEADYLVFCPGSLYGSILSNFLPDGIKEALNFSKSTKILVTNLVSNRNQTHHFTPQKYLNAFQKYTGLKKPFDIILTTKMTEKQFDKRYPGIAHAYAREHSHFVGFTEEQIKKVSDKGIKVITSDILSITPHLNRLRHSRSKLAKIFRKIIS